MDVRDVTVVIPTVEPSEKLFDYISELKDLGLDDIIVIDDGCSPIYNSLFKQLQKEDVIVFRHGINCGKGRALKTAFNYILVNKPCTKVIVTADSDGTYLPVDVYRVAMNAKENTITLGCRDYHNELISKNNRRTNALTHYLLKFLSGINMSDTQTGLRAYPASMLPYLILTLGERYDYEFNMIFDKKEIELNEVKITVTPRMSDKKTHFKAFKDSWIIISSFIIFILISLSSSILDLILYNFLINMLITSLPHLYISVATVLARCVSETYNYNLDKRLVFKAHETAHFSRYVMLAIGRTVASALFVSIFVFLLGDGELFIKIIVDLTIFFIGYRLEKNWVYSK